MDRLNIPTRIHMLVISKGLNQLVKENFVIIRGMFIKGPSKKD